jgi:tetratricopeptide (TPR) repeat protein
MVSFEPCRLPTITATRILLMLAVFAAVPAALAQPELSLDSALADDALSDMVAAIEEVRTREGPQSPELIGPLTALGLYYHEQGDPALALAVVEQARQVLRANYGLYSLAEAPLLQQLIAAEEARGNPAGAWDIEEKLLDLVSRHRGDARTVPILREIADKRLDVLWRYVHGEFPPQIVLGCYYSRGWRGGGSCRAGSRGNVKASLLNEAVSYYTQAINTLFRAEGYSSELVPELLMELVRVSYRYGRGGLGGRSLDYLMAYRVQNDPSALVRADALIAMADWDLVFARGNRDLIKLAHERYEAAYARLEGAEGERQLIAQMFAPEIPVVIPAFLPNPLVTEETPQSREFIDVAFDIDEEGRSDHIDILDTTTAPDAAQDSLVDLIDESLFRPRVTGGGIDETSRVVLRYYVSD